MERGLELNVLSNLGLSNLGHSMIMVMKMIEMADRCYSVQKVKCCLFFFLQCSYFWDGGDLEAGKAYLI